MSVRACACLRVYAFVTLNDVNTEVVLLNRYSMELPFS